LPIGKITYIDSPRCSDTVLRANLSSCDMTLNFYKLVLQFAAISSRATTLERVLDHLGEAVERCDTAVNRAKKSGSDEYIESVIDDEWVSSWAKLTKNSKRTAAVIMAAGARQGSSGNLRTALENVENRLQKSNGAGQRSRCLGKSNCQNLQARACCVEASIIRRQSP
jgi:hypothetical protein